MGQCKILRLFVIVFALVMSTNLFAFPAVSQALSDEQIRQTALKHLDEPRYQKELPFPTDFENSDPTEQSDLLEPSAPLETPQPQPLPDPNGVDPVPDALPEATTRVSNGGISNIAQIALWSLLGLACVLIVYNITRELKISRTEAVVAKDKPKSNTKKPALKRLTKREKGVLSEVDQMATEGAYKEAIHLLLSLCIERVQGQFSQDVLVAMTNREILNKAELPANVKASFSTIVSAEELSQFGQRQANQKVFEICRGHFETLDKLPAGS